VGNRGGACRYRSLIGSLQLAEAQQVDPEPLQEVPLMSHLSGAEVEHTLADSLRSHRMNHAADTRLADSKLKAQELAQQKQEFEPFRTAQWQVVSAGLLLSYPDPTHSFNRARNCPRRARGSC
jgi:hypothetical protein